MARKYSKGAAKKVKRALHKKKRGTLKSGRSGKTVTSRKQAIAIGLSEARKLYDRLEKVIGSFCPGLAKAPLHIHRYGASHHHPH